MSLYLMVDREYKRLCSMIENITDFSAAVDANGNQIVCGATPMDYNRGVATIHIEGVLEPERISWYDRYGITHTAYSDIRLQVAEAVDRGAKEIRLKINSPGGNVSGLLRTMKSVYSARKSGIKIESEATDLMASAAYMIGSQANKISASDELDTIGSLGVATAMYMSDYVKHLSNHESPNKRPDLKTEEGIKSVKDELSDIYNVVMPHVAEARGVSLDKINSDWGKGGVMTAKTALSRGMIDSINETKSAGRSGTTKGMKKMDMATLKAEHPDLYKAIFDAGKEAGAADFRELATAHMQLAEMSGDKDRAIKDICEGNDITPTCQVHHTTMATKRNMVENRGKEAPDPVGEGSDPQAAANETKLEDEISAAYAEDEGLVY